MTASDHRSRNDFRARDPLKFDGGNQPHVDLALLQLVGTLRRGVQDRFKVSDCRPWRMPHARGTEFRYFTTEIFVFGTAANSSMSVW